MPHEPASLTGVLTVQRAGLVVVRAPEGDVAQTEDAVGLAEDVACRTSGPDLTAALWTEAGARARAYLVGRGLQEEALRAWRVGFHAADRREPAASWGLDDGEDVWLPRGITLPWLTGVKVWQVKVRRATNGRDKYASVRGGHPLLYGADTLVPGGPAVMCEGELDTLLIWQAVHDRSAAVSLGSASRRPTRLAALLLAQADPILLAADTDDEGELGAQRFRELAPRARRIRPPVGKERRRVRRCWRTSSSVDHVRAGATEGCALMDGMGDHVMVPGPTCRHFSTRHWRNSTRSSPSSPSARCSRARTSSARCASIQPIEASPTHRFRGFLRPRYHGPTPCCGARWTLSSGTAWASSASGPASMRFASARISRVRPFSPEW